MRATFMEYPEDINTYTVDTQYFLGPNLLIAPVFSKSGEVTFYVPGDEDNWVSWFDKTKTYTGGKWYTEIHDFSSLPIMIRPGTVTCINTSMKDSISDYRDGLDLLINGAIKETLKLDLVDIKNPDQVTGEVTITPKGSDLSVNGAAIGNKWGVTYLGNAKTDSAEVEMTEAPGSVAFKASGSFFTLQYL